VARRDAEKFRHLFGIQGQAVRFNGMLKFAHELIMAISALACAYLCRKQGVIKE
jgi:hypothetical protein